MKVQKATDYYIVNDEIIKFIKVLFMLGYRRDTEMSSNYNFVEIKEASKSLK